jgi:hypothetical protein
MLQKSAPGHFSRRIPVSKGSFQIGSRNLNSVAGNSEKSANRALQSVITRSIPMLLSAFKKRVPIAGMQVLHVCIKGVRRYDAINALTICTKIDDLANGALRTGLLLAPVMARRRC